MEEKQVILGQVPSKSNCYKIITLYGKGSLAKTPALKLYEKSFYLQCNHYRNKNIKGLFELHLNVYNSSQRRIWITHLRSALTSWKLVKLLKTTETV